MPEPWPCESNSMFHHDDDEEFSTLIFLSLCAQHALEDMCNYLSDEGEVAIFDATNTTHERRQVIYDYCTQTYCFRVFFVESICDSEEIIDANIRVCQFRFVFVD